MKKKRNSSIEHFTQFFFIKRKKTHTDIYRRIDFFTKHTEQLKKIPNLSIRIKYVVRIVLLIKIPNKMFKSSLSQRMNFSTVSILSTF